MVVVPAANTHSELRVRGTGSVKILRVPVVLPSGSGPEEGLVPYLVNHKKD